MECNFYFIFYIAHDNIIFGRNFDKETRYKETYTKKELIDSKKEIEKYKVEVRTLQLKYETLLKERLVINDKLVTNSGILVNNSLNTVKSTVSALSHLNRTYPDAPLLKLEEYDVLGNKDNRKFSESIIYSYQNDQLDKEIGDIYISLYYKPCLPGDYL